MAFLKNTWYMMGWAAELSQPGAMVHRRIAGEPILAYRLSDGHVNAILDRCHIGSCRCIAAGRWVTTLNAATTGCALARMENA